MSYPAIEIKREIVKSLAGKCKQAAGGVLAYTGEVYSDCAKCREQCEIVNSCGFVELGFNYIYKSGSRGVLEWKCPSCCCIVIEECSPIESISKSEEVKSDPLCHRCRK